jgi:hypothetical protein
MRGRDIGEEVLTKQAIANTTAVAAGSGDATEIDGPAIIRTSLGSLYESVKLSIHGNATLASGLTLTIAANLQDSADGSTWADFGTALAATVVATGESGGSAELFETFLDADIRGAKAYLRAQVTPDLTHTGTDTALIGGTLIFGGPTTYPAN